MLPPRSALLVRATLFATLLAALAPAEARADFFSAPTDSATGGRQICAANGLLCLSAPTIDTPPEIFPPAECCQRTDPERAGPSFVTADLGTHCIHLAEYVTGRKLIRIAD